MLSCHIAAAPESLQPDCFVTVSWSYQWDACQLFLAYLKSIFTFARKVKEKDTFEFVLWQIPFAGLLSHSPSLRAPSHPILSYCEALAKEDTPHGPHLPISFFRHLTIPPSASYSILKHPDPEELTLPHGRGLRIFDKPDLFFLILEINTPIFQYSNAPAVLCRHGPISLNIGRVFLWRNRAPLLVPYQ